jgi:methylase of polypeptide subunit release factors
VQNLEIEVLHQPEVRPTVFSLFLANALRAREGDRTACDLGTGSGILAIVLARMGVEHVTAIDHSAPACEIAEENARKNGVADRVEVVHGELADLAGSDFDLLVANPPTMPSVGAPHYAAGGGDHLGVVRMITDRLDSWLAPDGRAQIVLSSLVVPEVLLLFEDRGFAGIANADLLVPFRPFYADCFTEEELDSLLCSGRALAEDGSGALSEIVTAYTFTRADPG